MKIFRLSLIFILLLTACKSEPEEIPEQELPTVEEDVSYLALGDSYTIGESVDPSLRWPVQLVDSLRDRGVEVNQPLIIARTGWTTQDLLAAMDQRLESGQQFDLVSLLIGVNNQYQGKSIEAYETDLNELFKRAIARSERGAEGVFAVSIPDYGATPFGASNAEEIGKEIDEFNAVFKKLASEYQVPFYNITPISRSNPDDSGLVASDGLHPSGKQYGLWVEEIVGEVANLLPAEN